MMLEIASSFSSPGGPGCGKSGHVPSAEAQHTPRIRRGESATTISAELAEPVEKPGFVLRVLRVSALNVVPCNGVA